MLPDGIVNAEVTSITNNQTLCDFLNENGGNATIEGTTVKLGADMVGLKKQMHFSNDESNPINFDLNGHYITSDYEDGFAVWKNGAGNLNITDTSGRKDSLGKIYAEIRSNKKTTLYVGKGTVNISNIILRNMLDASGTDGTVVTGYGSDVRVNIAGCLIVSENTGISLQSSMVLNLDDSTMQVFSGSAVGYGIKVSGSNCIANITNTQLDTLKTGTYGLYVDAETAFVKTNGNCNFNTQSTSIYAKAGSVELNGGQYGSKQFGDTVAVYNTGKVAIRNGATIKGRYGVALYSDAAQLKLEKCTITHLEEYPNSETLAAYSKDAYDALFGTCFKGNIPSSQLEYEPNAEYWYTDQDVTVTDNHAYGDWKVTKKPTYSEEGVAWRYCANCTTSQPKTMPRVDPIPPAKVTATLTTKYSKTGGYNDVKITWSKVSNADGYTVYYNKASSYKQIKLGDYKGTTAYKKDLAAGTKYNIEVHPYVIDSDGNKSYCPIYNTTTVTTLKKVATPKVTKSGTKVKVSWTNIAGETGYQISKSAKKSGTNIVATYKTTTGKSKILSATKGKTYYYKVRAYKTVGSTKIYGPWSAVKAFKR